MPEPAYPNLSSYPDAVGNPYEPGQPLERQIAEPGLAYQDDSILVTLYLSGNVADVLEFLNDNGATVRVVAPDYIEAYLPAGLLGAASQQPGVTRIDESVPPTPGYGTVVSQGVALHNAAAWHNNGYKGKGVKIGIIHSGFDGWRSLQGTELPSTLGGVRCYTERDDGNYGGLEVCDVPAKSSYGTAIGETIMDIAPEATLYLAGFRYSSNLQHIVQWMADEGVQVISVSNGWVFDGPGDGTSPRYYSPLKAVDQAVSEGIIWVSMAGNEVGHIWYGAFADSDNDNQHEWEGTDETQDLNLEAGERVIVELRWDDQWGGSNKDLDVSLELDSTNEVVASGEDRQNGEDDDNPYERFSYTVPSDGRYDVRVKLISGSAPGWLQLTLRSRDGLQYYTKSYSITNPAESANPGMLAVGATHYWDTNTIATYSSQGPTPDGRVKPDITGVSCTEVARYPSRDRFGGECWLALTGVATAHVAGLAALVAEQYPRFTPVQIANYLKTNAAERGATGPDNVWGHGFAQLPTPPDCVDDLTADGATTGAWASDCQSHVASPNLTDDADATSYARYYTLTPTEEKEVTITLASAEDTFLYLREGNDARSGDAVATNDDIETGNTNSRITATLKANTTYTIEATTYDAATAGSFTLTLAGLDASGGTPPPPPVAGDCAVTALTADGASAGTWADDCVSQTASDDPNDASDAKGYARYYSFTTTEQRTVTISLDSAAVDTLLYLRAGAAQSGTAVAKNDDKVLGNTNSEISQSLAAGSYTIEATTYKSATEGSFTLTLAGLSDTGGGTPPPAADPCPAAATALTADGVSQGTWDSACVSLEGSPDTTDGADARSYAAYYTFTAKAEEVTITLESAQDTYLYLREGDNVRTGDAVATNDDIDTAARNYNSRITETLTAGTTYTIEVTTYKAATEGSFTLTIDGLGTPPPPACAVGDTLTPGQSCAGQDFTAMVESNGDLSLRFSGTTAPPSGLSFTRSGNDWTVAGLPAS